MKPSRNESMKLIVFLFSLLVGYARRRRHGAPPRRENKRKTIDWVDLRSRKKGSAVLSRGCWWMNKSIYWWSEWSNKAKKRENKRCPKASHAAASQERQIKQNNQLSLQKRKQWKSWFDLFLSFAEGCLFYWFTWVMAGGPALCRTAIPFQWSSCSPSISCCLPCCSLAPAKKGSLLFLLFNWFD